MAIDVIARLRAENPVATLREPGTDALFAQIVAGPREPARARRTTPSRRRVALILLAGLAIAAPLAVAARTTGALDFVLGDPAPKSIARALDLMLPADRPANEGPPQNGPTQKDVVKGSERVVAEITLRSGRKARLYAVDVRDGSRCFAAIGGPFGAGSCFSPAGVRRFPVIAGAQSGGAGAKGEFAERPVLYGRVTLKAGVSLVIRYVDGASAVIPTSDGWFLYEVPRFNWLRAHAPLRLDVLDAAGRVIGSLGDLFGLHPPKGP